MNSIMKKIANFFLSIKNIIRWIPTLFKDREWDYSFMLEIEQRKLKNMIKWYEQNDYGHSVSGHRIVREMKLAISLIDIILEKDNWWHIDNAYYPEYYNFVANQPLQQKCFILDKYVNTRNYKRFFPLLSDNVIKQSVWTIELRVKKAWVLYNALRERYMLQWWD